jgi:plasmid stability protein
MPVSLTLKNIPDEVYARLKQAAGQHRRSLNSEAIVCLEAQLLPAAVNPSERLENIRKLRASLATPAFLPEDIDMLKREGRP